MCCSKRPFPEYIFPTSTGLSSIFRPFRTTTLRGAGTCVMTRLDLFWYLAQRGLSLSEAGLRQAQTSLQKNFK